MSETKKYQLNSVGYNIASVPVFSETFSRLPFVAYGENNLMPNYLIDQYNNCAIHKAIITSKVNQICGDGMVSLDNPMATINLINNKETVAEVYRKCALDLVLFGAYAVNIIWSRDRKTIAEIYHCDVSRLRCGKLNPETDEIDEYFYSSDWTNLKKFPASSFPAFDVEAKNPSQILYYKCYQPNNTYYATPDYSGAMAAIAIDIEIKNFHQSNLRRGLSPSLFINFNNGQPSSEEQRIIMRSIEEQYSGTDNAGAAIVSFNDSKDTAPEVVQIDKNTNDSYYENVYEDIIRSILSAHRISSGELFGISGPSRLGAQNEIVDHSEYIRKTVIMPYQNELLPTFNKLVSMKYQKQTTFEIKPLSLFEVGDVVEQPIVENKPGTPIEAEAMTVNENIKGLKGREYQSLMRIVREYNKEKITREQAMQMLMSGYGLSKEECVAWLGEE